MNTYSLPLFPLNVVLCPGGLLPLRIFEARYLDMVKDCLRNKTRFGVVTVLPNDAQEDGSLPFANIGTSVIILDADVTTVGLIMIRCYGEQRFRVDSVSQQADGLIIGQVDDIANDLHVAIPDDLQSASKNLEKLIESFPQQGIPQNEIPIIAPYHFDDCAWVANRWLELLDLPLIQKHRMMVLDSPLLRLELVQDILTANI